ncbi:hypothetical protein [Adonisia turfae]|uniref:hypothetical protein n=1 Tax=Adonisia turfae TaxID=2950184 RepID=UPI0020299F62|nr:hypothetical protein [Adonisia turfae]
MWESAIGGIAIGGRTCGKVLIICGKPLAILATLACCWWPTAGTPIPSSFSSKGVH